MVICYAMLPQGFCTLVHSLYVGMRYLHMFLFIIFQYCLLLFIIFILFLFIFIIVYFCYYHLLLFMIIVYCYSAGVGRTGTFIALGTLLQHIKDHDWIDVFGLACEMRQHRNHMIQTEVRKRERERERARKRVEELLTVFLLPCCRHSTYSFTRLW